MPKGDASCWRTSPRATAASVAPMTKGERDHALVNDPIRLATRVVSAVAAHRAADAGAI